MPVGAALAAASVGSALIGASAAKSAAGTQAQAANQAGQYQLQAAQLAAQLQLGMFNTIRGDLSPYRNFGAGGLSGVAALMGLPQPSPQAGAGAPGTVVNGGVYGGLAGGGSGGPLTVPGLGAGGGAGAGPYANFGGLAGGDDFGGGAPGTLSGGFGAGSGGPGVGSVAGGFYGEPTNVDWNAFTQANPDVLAWAQAGHGDPNVPIEQQSLQQRLAYWYHNASNAGETTRATTPLPLIASGGGNPGSGTPAPTGGPLGGGTSQDIQSFLANTPGYQFAKQQGTQAVENTLSARGLGGLSGSLGKGLGRFVTGLADQTYQQQLANFFQVAGIGQSAANQTGAFGNSAAGGAAGSLVGGAGAYGNGIIGAANASAAGTVGAANAISGGLQGGANGYLTSQLLGMYGGGGGRYPASTVTGSQGDLLGTGYGDFGGLFGGG